MLLSEPRYLKFLFLVLVFNGEFRQFRLHLCFMQAVCRMIGLCVILHSLRIIFHSGIVACHSLKKPVYGSLRTAVPRSQHPFLDMQALAIASHFSQYVTQTFMIPLHLGIGSGQSCRHFIAFRHVMIDGVAIVQPVIGTQQIRYDFQYESRLLLLPCFGKYGIKQLGSFRIIFPQRENTSRRSGSIHHHVHVITLLRCLQRFPDVIFAFFQPGSVRIENGYTRQQLCPFIISLAIIKQRQCPVIAHQRRIGHLLSTIYHADRGKHGSYLDLVPMQTSGFFEHKTETL